MATRKTSLVARVAWGSSLAASAAALLAAFATSALASYFIQRAEDRRLEDAAITFAVELDEGPATLDAIREIHRDETEELNHTGLVFAVYAADGALLVGDKNLAQPSSQGCATLHASTLRVCRTQSTRGLVAVVGAAHTQLWHVLLTAAVLAAALAAALAWLASQPLSRHAVAPLTRLRERIAQLEVHDISRADLGTDEQVIEVDALRAALGQLITQIEQALAQAERFAVNAAHELRHPLTAVRAELELLSESITEPTLRADALRTWAQLTALSELVERLLILSLPVRPHHEAHEVVSLRDLLEDTMASLPNEDRRRVRLSDQDALVCGDTLLLGTLIANALGNGLKFGSLVSTTITQRGTLAILHIDDDGPGVSEDERERVFEPFYRTPDALRRRIPGHGLGLALIRHIAQHHGGNAHFAPPYAPGARLEICLPSTPSCRA